ncbi:MAG TPA: DUF2608 domain-containing protein [Gammaproteobacteria bacterium]|nr:DUF2608 domain-containing protein [Gammaproteobacteria bacterium]
MIKRFFSVSVISATLLLLPLVGHSKSNISEVKSFTEMYKKYIKNLKHPERTLLVMDNDDTLTMMSCPDKTKPETCQYLGSAAWFSWQESQVKIKAQPRVADSFSELLVAADLLFSINNMTYTATDVPGILNEITHSGIRLLVETARGNSNVSATERQFSNIDTDNKKYSSLLSFISNQSLNFGEPETASKASPYLPCKAEKEKTHWKPITYQQGIMYLSGQDKGKILKCMLNRYNAQENVTPVSNIIFIDDTKANVKKVHSAFKNDQNYTMSALHYTALSSHKKALTKGIMADTYQHNAMKRWNMIKHALENSLQNPVLP